ncbi:MAG: helix-turn-helix domain-containing protein [Haloferacaceae archaeon]
MLRLEFQMPADGLLLAIADTVGADTVEFDNVVPMCADRIMVFASLTVPGDRDVAAALDGVSDIAVKHCSATSEAGLYHASFVTDFDESVVASVVSEEAVPHRFVGTEDEISAVVTVDDWNQLRDLAATIEREYGIFDLRGTSEIERPGYPLGRDRLEYGVRGKLTPDQLEVLRTAYEMGHFAVPQQATSGEVAEALGIGRSTFSERVRRSQNNLLRVLFSDTG